MTTMNDAYIGHPGGLKQDPSVYRSYPGTERKSGPK